VDCRPNQRAEQAEDDPTCLPEYRRIWYDQTGLLDRVRLRLGLLPGGPQRVYASVSFHGVFLADRASLGRISLHAEDVANGLDHAGVLNNEALAAFVGQRTALDTIKGRPGVLSTEFG
jgi:hypothetical protein